MGMSISEYNNILYCDLLIKIKGYRAKLLNEERMMRKVGFSALISASVAGAKELPKTESEYWPVDGDKDYKEEREEYERDKKEALKNTLSRLHGKV